MNKNLIITKKMANIKGRLSQLKKYYEICTPKNLKQEQ